ncbi:inner membrane protein YiaA [Burkholderia ubonensis]|uniref:inner membrane protein YiaA n=1 Tax=Burkholderia ubonensis TaxID=101571 RepID=UPI0009B46DDF|nr:inner membrane protein YiaA [Burkholderia ubonensis]
MKSWLDNPNHSSFKAHIRNIQQSKTNPATGGFVNNNQTIPRPTGAFIGASWASLIIGMGAYLIGLWNGTMALSEKGFYFAILILGLFSAISLQKTVRDKLEGIPVTNMYMGVCWVGLGLSLLLLTIGLFNATFDLSVKGFYGMAYLLSLYAVVTVQKNVRDLGAFRSPEPTKAAGELEPHIEEAR